MSQPISGFLFDREMQEAGFTRHEMSNQRLRDAAYRLLVRGRLYRFNDADEIEYGVSGPFNDDEGRAIVQPVEQTRALTEDARNAEAVAEIVQWMDFTNKPRFDIKVFDETLRNGAKLYASAQDSLGARRWRMHLNLMIEEGVTARKVQDYIDVIDAALAAARPASGETE
jgi:hypothetical protein